MVKDVRTVGDTALQKLLTDDKIWDVENYAAVEILGTDTGNVLAVEVRILDGAFENRTAFVLRSEIVEGPPPLEPFPDHGYSPKTSVRKKWKCLIFM